MTKTQRRQMVKGEAFNSILKIYHPKAKFCYDEYNRESSYTEQREEKVRSIMERYFEELKNINEEQPTNQINL